MDDTIFALSSGRPPAAIAVVRVSGPQAGAALKALAGTLPAPRRAVVRTLRDAQGQPLDRALLLWFPGPRTATGEDLAEMHLHGGRAVVDGVLAELGRTDLGLRLAEPGEFTRRALFNGVIDINEAEGLADLLEAETEAQRRDALARTSGVVGQKIAEWTERLLAIAARFEAAIDYDEEVGDVVDSSTRIAITQLRESIAAALAGVPAERLRDGIRVVFAGPPNAGKSSLFNAMLGDEAAIVSDIAGTTRDVIERPVAIAGIPFVLIDTAGLRDSDDQLETIGIARAGDQIAMADIVVQLGEPLSDGPHEIMVSSQSDRLPSQAGRMVVSAVSGAGLSALTNELVRVGQSLLPAEGEVALSRRLRDALANLLPELAWAAASDDLVLGAEHIRRARAVLDRLTGHAGLDEMLDMLFGRFCLGK